MVNCWNIRIAPDDHGLLPQVVDEIKRCRPHLKDIKLTHPMIVHILITHFLECDGN